MNTPGYNLRLTIKFIDRRAYYWSPGNHRWLPIKRALAEQHVAGGEADLWNEEAVRATNEVAWGIAPVFDGAGG